MPYGRDESEVFKLQTASLKISKPNLRVVVLSECLTGGAREEKANLAEAERGMEEGIWVGHTSGKLRPSRDSNGRGCGRSSGRGALVLTRDPGSRVREG